MGYTWERRHLRRAMGKKKRGDGEARRFYQGATSYNLPKAKAKRSSTEEKFAGYGLNKSHAAAGAKIVTRPPISSGSIQWFTALR